MFWTEYHDSLSLKKRILFFIFFYFFSVSLYSVQNIAIHRIRLIIDSSNTLVYRLGPNRHLLTSNQDCVCDCFSYYTATLLHNFYIFPIFTDVLSMSVCHQTSSRLWFCCLTRYTVLHFLLILLRSFLKQATQKSVMSFYSQRRIVVVKLHIVAFVYFVLISSVVPVWTGHSATGDRWFTGRDQRGGGHWLAGNDGSGTDKWLKYDHCNLCSLHIQYSEFVIDAILFSSETKLYRHLKSYHLTLFMYSLMRNMIVHSSVLVFSYIQ